MNTNLLDFLVKTGLIGLQQARTIVQRHQQMGGWLLDLILESCQLSDVDLARSLGQLYQLNVIDIAKVHPRPAALELLTKDASRRHCVLPFSFDRSGETLLVAIADPELASAALDMLRQVWPRPMQVFIAPRIALQAMIDQPMAALSAQGAGMSSGRGRQQASFSGRGVSRSDLEVGHYDTGSTSYGWGVSGASGESSPAASPQALELLEQRLHQLESKPQAAHLEQYVQQLEQRLQQLESKLIEAKQADAKQQQHAQQLQQHAQQLQQHAQQLQHAQQQHAQQQQHTQQQHTQQQHAQQQHAQQQQQLEQRLHQLERGLQSQVSQLQADNQALRMQVQRLEHTLEAEVELVRQLQGQLLSLPQVDRKAYLERIAPLR
jgi:hypothetical protein